ncbi:NADH-quinone oxidoreductase subunit C [Nonomuraea endophytica]|uniref:NADH-quinone oxidoreductase subunit C n=1 Tax=Nonomuraea endophytica TaxID=714136 RepID=A0A7W7ZXC9_9ACTN|nr:NADH-quinone oxidoreductase subunit C [Nonomuraea endophytica]MBB5075509.1 NADH-quinone oxidoreductase subunit C [Nonomuraea endophytica]
MSDNLPEVPETEVPQTPIARQGMFGAHDTGDTSGYGGLVVRRAPELSTPRPFGGYFDALVDTLDLDDAIERVVVDRGELTLHVKRERLVEVLRKLRDDADLRFELSLGVTGVHYPHLQGEELHSVVHLASITHNTRVRVETWAPDADPHIPSTVAVYPTHDWHEREAYDFFGIVYDGHPALTRIMMPDDWDGHPQRKDYPLGGIPVEYRGATIPAPDERRSYA